MQSKAALRILLVQHHYLHQGTFKRCECLAEHIATEERKVSILCTDSEHSYWLPRRMRHSTNPHLEYLVLPRLGQVNGPLSMALRLVIAAFWLGFMPRFDLVHAFALGHPFNAGVAVLLRLLKPTRFMVDWDDCWGGGYGRYVHSMVDWFMSFQERKLPQFLRSQWMTLVSSRLKEKAIAMGIPPDRISLIINGFTPYATYQQSPVEMRRKHGLSPDLIYGCSSGHTYSMSFQNLVEAFAAACRREPRLRLLLVGDFRKYGKLGRTIAGVLDKNRAFFDQFVVTTGELPFTIMQEHIVASDFVVLPMEASEIDRCRFPIRFGDYLASGKTMAANPVGEIQRILTQERLGFLAPPDNNAAFSDAILQAAHQGRPYDPERVRQLAAQYSWISLAAQLNSVYSRVLGVSSADTRPPQEGKGAEPVANRSCGEPLQTPGQAVFDPGQSDPLQKPPSSLG
jgi:glycosyltransferase involved in cell wall biosynthesis